MASKEDIIYKVYSSKKSPSRDENVMHLINQYMATPKMVASLSSGVLDNIPKITLLDRKPIERVYNITADDMKQIQKSSEFRKIGMKFSVLKVGLVISYLETKRKVYLVYLSTLVYGSYMSNYYKNGFNRALMEYTINAQDGKQDYKRLGTNLLPVINKKLETIIKYFEPKMKGQITDALIRELLASIHSRFNLMIKTVAQKYYQYREDPEVKVMMQYSKSLDGKDVISPMSLIQALRSRAVSQLEYPKDNVFKMCGLTVDSPIKENRRFRGLIIETYKPIFPLLIKLSNAYIDEWLRRNRKDPSVQNFKKTFVKQMSGARNLLAINKILKVIIITICKHTHENTRSISKINLKNTIIKYVLGNIVLTFMDMYKL